MKNLFFLLVLILSFNSCDTDTNGEIGKALPLLTLLSENETYVGFENRLADDAKFDVFRYRNYYNGGGVAIGDINNDGLSDIYFTSNIGSNRLYLNQGDFKFQDITEAAGIGGGKAWSTGVSMVDINADGFLDIYVCNSGNIEGDDKENELFINQGDLTFLEKSKEYGLNDKGFSTHAVFFDYDKDGDLDCYMLNNSFRPISTFGLRNIREERDSLGGDKLYKNENEYFVDVSVEAGIYGSVIGFGLGVTVGDVNKDGHLDIYVSNDFFERDYLYINQQNGTFKESLKSFMGHISLSSMGADMADINNDAFPDIFVTDMLPEDEKRRKTLYTYESYDVYNTKLKNDYFHQYSRNMLHMNNGDSSFSEVAQLMNVNATDWSWGALLMDLNNNSKKEILVCNGIFRDVTNQDFITYLSNDATIREAMKGKKVDFKKFIDLIPSTPLMNYLFTLDSSYKYSNVAKEWGMDTLSFSNGAAYGDLDNDGDYDLVINNVNQKAFLYRNNSDTLLNNNYLKFVLKGIKDNVNALGTKITAYVESQTLYYEHMPMRGFQSSMDYKPIIGLGTRTRVDSVVIVWPNSAKTIIEEPKINSLIVLNQEDSKPGNKLKNNIKEIENFSFSDHTKKSGLEFKHNENKYIDFDNERLKFRMHSTLGPALTKADLNNDGMEDFFIGGAKDQAGKLFIQYTSGKFVELKISALEEDKGFEDIDATFFDADNDGDLDLYVVSGGNEHNENSPNYRDRLYFNTGSPSNPSYDIVSDKQIYLYSSGATVAPSDYDKDGDVDLFVGTRIVPGFYGIPATSYLLENDGKGNFSIVTSPSSFEGVGMVTDAKWLDYNRDTYPDLILVGEWMPVTLFENKDGRTFEKKELPGISNSEGWWNRIEETDIDGDGDIDFVLGNLGLNSKFEASAENPLSLYINDFDNNRSLDHIYCFRKDDKDYPIHLKHDLEKQVIAIKKKYIYYKDFAEVSIDKLFPEEQLKKSIVLSAKTLKSAVLFNEGDKFRFEPLPLEVQVSPVYGIVAKDINNDSLVDLLITGNFFDVKPEEGRYDANYGLVLANSNNDKFEVLKSSRTGFFSKGEVRNMVSIDSGSETYVLLAKNDDHLQLFLLR